MNNEKKAAPTPEAERPALVGGVTSGDVDHLIASLQSARDRMLRVLPEKFGEGFDGDMDTLLDAVRYLKRLKRVALPAAQDGDYPANIREAMDALDWWARHYVMADDYDPKADVRTLTGYMRLQQLPTPNAIRGDKGAEAVAFRFLKHLAGGVYAWTRWLNMDELHHYGEGGNLVQGPHPDWQIEYAYAAPTQAAAKDTP